jgi:hypothetical protein
MCTWEKCHPGERARHLADSLHDASEPGTFPWPLLLHFFILLFFIYFF